MYDVGHDMAEGVKVFCLIFIVRAGIMKSEMNMTVGSVPLTLFRFALPTFFANLLQSFYNMADMLVVGQLVGSAGVAAISNASTLVFLINAICLGVTTGGAVLIAQYKGAGNQNGQKETMGTLYTLMGVLAGLITLSGLALYQVILQAMNVPAKSMSDAEDYMVVILCGTIFVFGYNTTCSILRGGGDVTSPLLFVGMATVLNVLLDYLLVGGWGMGTVGAAYATVLSQGVSFFLSIWYLKRRDFLFDFNIRSFAIKKTIAASVLKISLPTAIQMAVVNVSYLLIAAMLNEYGVTVAAAAGIGLKINTFAGMPCWAVGSAITAMAAQNMGAGLTDRVKKVCVAGVTINLAITLLAVIVVQEFSEELVMVFDTDPAVISAGTAYLRICCFGNSLVYAGMYGFDSFAVGVGAAPIAMINALLDSVFIRLPLCFMLRGFFLEGYEGVFWGQALSPILPALIGGVYFLLGGWKRKKLVDRNSQGEG